MSSKLFLAVCIGLLTTASAAPSVAVSLSAEAKRSLQHETTLMIDLLQGYHYSDRSFNDLKASELVDRYLEAMDKERLGFLASDVEFFHRRFDRNLKTVYLFRGDVQPAYEIFDRRVERAQARGEWIRRRFDEGIVFEEAPTTVSAGGSLERTAEDKSAESELATREGKQAGKAVVEPWAADLKTLDVRWEKRLRREILRHLLRGRSLEDAKAAVRDSFAGRLKQLCAWDAQHVRELFLDSMLESFDAHSGYFSKESAQSFTSLITGSELGLGLDLLSHEGHVHVEAVVAGGPADLEGTVVAGERLLSIQEEGGSRVDVSNLKLREVSRLLRGVEGSRVRLGFGDEQGAPTRESTLTRARHERSEGHASAVLVEVPEGPGARKVGLISLPSFYSNPEAEGGASSTSTDVEELLRKLVAKGAGGIVIDLRGNGGGVMNEALKTVGLFISKGPVFLSRGLDRKVTRLSDDDEKLSYGGPLVVLVSGNSASASEAFSGALQWYGRALVVGSPQTFGKGSAQDYIDLRTLASGALSTHQDEWGLLRLTRQLFYFPDGHSPQLEGVKADLPLPAYWRDKARRMERELPNALPNEVLASGLERPASNGSDVFLTPALMAQLKTLSVERQGSLAEFVLAERSTRLREKEDPYEALPLVPETWLAAQAAYEQERIALVEAWNTLLRSEGYVHERVLLASMERVEARHQEALRGSSGPGAARVGLTVGGIHYFETSPGGRILDVPLRSLDFQARRADASVLAASWRKATGVTVTDEAIVRVLGSLRLALFEQDTQPDVSALLGRELRGGLDAETFSRGVRSFMDRLVDFDDDLRSGRFFMDVRRREALRVAADWARLHEEQRKP